MSLCLLVSDIHPTPSVPPVFNAPLETPILHNEFGHLIGNVPRRVHTSVGCGTSRVGPSVMQPHVSSGMNVEVGQIFFSKNDVKMRFSMLAIKENFEIQVGKSNKKLYSVSCTHETCE